MEYSNPEIPEGINASKENPLKEFFLLLGGIGACMAATIIILSLLAGRLAVYIPFSTEEELVAGGILPEDEGNPEVSAYLQGLVDDLRDELEAPEDMHFTVHYLNSDTENAYATLGGHIYMFRGLLELLPNENALLLVLAHEMAHIKHRHPIIAMGRGVVIGLLLASITGLSGDYFVGQVVSSTGVIALMAFNRDQEREADATALAAVARRNGHIAGSEDLFKILRDLESRDPINPPEFLRTHPFGNHRIENVRELAQENHWSLEGGITEIPPQIQKLVTESELPQ